MLLEHTCRRCLAAKPSTEFRQDTRYVSGLSSWCKECHRVRNSEWAKENRERLTAKAAGWRSANPEKTAQANRRSKRKHAKKLAEQHAAWAKGNRHLRRATDAKRKAAKRQATPKWANHGAMLAVYRRAVRIQEQTGQRMHVDHIVPIQSPIVCGLHCPANLQVLPGPENEAKRNFWWPDMPDIEAAQRQSDLFIRPADPEAVYDAPLRDLFAGEAA